MTISRRQFVVWISAALPVAIVARRTDALASEWIAADDATLRALAETVLPSELSRAEVGHVIREFQRWIDNYREHAELVHGYGTSALRFTRPSPRAKWAAQLQGLRTAKASGTRAGFIGLSAEKRKDVIRELLKDERLDRMPDVGSAQHVAVALMAFYFTSPAAADLCYAARIGREQCRPLSTSSRKPLPLASPRV